MCTIESRASVIHVGSRIYTMNRSLPTRTEYIARAVYAVQNNLWYAILIVLLALTSIGLLFYELWYPDATPESITLARRIDLVIAWIFLTDFFLGLYFGKFTEGRMTFFKHNWLNLISSIPISHELAHALRVLRILRAVRVIRAGTNFYFARSRERRVAQQTQEEL